MLALTGLPLLLAGRRARAQENLGFGELYKSLGVLGLQFSDKVKRLNGSAVSVGGFMAPPLKAEANFFVLTEIPMSLCPFCSSDADWQDNILVVYLAAKQTFVQYNAPIAAQGILDVGPWTDPRPVSSASCACATPLSRPPDPPMLSLRLENSKCAFPGLDAPALAIDRFVLPAGAHLAVTGASARARARSSTPSPDLSG